MPERIPQSVTIRVPLQAYLASDHISPATGKTIAITISKNGAAYGNPSGGATNAVEIASGSYYVDLSTTDTGTTGPLFVLGTASGVDPINALYNVANAHNAGFDGVPSATAGAAGGLWILGANAAAATTLTGTAASGGTPAADALKLTGGAASTTSGGVAGRGLYTVGGAGAATTNGAASGTRFEGGGTTTVSGGRGLHLVGTGSLSDLDTSTNGFNTAAITGTTLTFSGAVAFQSTFVVSTSTSLGALSCTTLTASGAVAFQSTFTVTGATSLAAVTTSGTVTFNAFTVSNATTLSGAVSLGSTLGVTGATTLAALSCTTLTASGAVAFQSTFAVTGTTTLAALTTTGTMTVNAFTVTNNFTVSGNWLTTGTTTWTGAAAFSAGLTSNITGNLSGSVGSVTGAVGSVTGNVGGSVASVVGNVGGSVASVVGNVGGNVAGSVASVSAAVTLSAADSPTIRTGTAQAGGNTTITLDSGASGTNNAYTGCLVKITSGTGAAAGQCRTIASYVGSTKVATVDYAWEVNPDVTSVFAVLYADSPALNSSLQVSASGTGGTVTANVTQWLGSTPNVLVSGRVDASIGANNAGNLAADLQTIKTQTVTCAAGVTVGAFVGNATHALTVDGSGFVTFANTTIATVTNLTNLPSIPANWLTAAGIAAGALNGKGDWLVSSSYPANFGALSIGVTGHITNVDTLTTYSGNVPQSGDCFTRIGAAGVGLTAVSLAANGVDAIVIEVGMNMRQAMSPIAAAAGGTITGNGTGTVIVKAANNAAVTRATGTIDGSGNRSVSLNLPA